MKIARRTVSAATVTVTARRTVSAATVTVTALGLLAACGGELDVEDREETIHRPAVASACAPPIESGKVAALFVYRDCDGTWRVRATAGGGGASYAGVVTSDKAMQVRAYQLEGKDVLDTSDPRKIRFQLAMYQAHLDGLDIVLPAGARATLTLEKGGPLLAGQSARQVSSPFALGGATSGGARLADSGLYGIWFGTHKAEVLASPYISGGQVVLQWRDIEPQQGKYDFSALDKQLAAYGQRGQKTTVQVNGSRKPDYLFDKVPYNPRKLHPRQVQDPKGTLMYWHPTYLAAYRSFLTAYASHLATTPHRSAVLAVRMNFNRIGTEISMISAKVSDADRQLSSWVVPPGVAAGTVKPWTKALEQDYEQQVLRRYKRFPVRVLVRFGVDDSLIQTELKAGKMGYFHTGTGMEPNQFYKDPGRYQPFLKWCKPGTTFCFLEEAEYYPKGMTLGQTPTPFGFSEAQYLYWRKLSDMHVGVSYIGSRPRAYVLTKPGSGQLLHRETLAFATRYVGHHADPLGTPGAWIALRGAGGNFHDDYYIHIKKVGTAKVSDVSKVGPKASPYGAWAQTIGAGGYVRLQLDRSFAASLQGQVRVKVRYLDSGNATWRLVYDAASNATKRALEVTNTASGKWKVATATLGDHAFDRRGPGGSDLALVQLGGAPLTVHMVEVERP